MLIDNVTYYIYMNTAQLINDILDCIDRLVTNIRKLIYIIQKRLKRKRKRNVTI